MNFALCLVNVTFMGSSLVLSKYELNLKKNEKKTVVSTVLYILQYTMCRNSGNITFRAYFAFNSSYKLN